jgi:hypothetical protein
LIGIHRKREEKVFIAIMFDRFTLKEAHRNHCNQFGRFTVRNFSRFFCGGRAGVGETGVHLLVPLAVLPVPLVM